jgi:hypothetical protein
MPAYFALGFLALLALIYTLRWMTQADPAALASLLKYAAIAIALVGVALLVVGGRFGFLFLLASLLYPLWRRWRTSRGSSDPGVSASQGQTSSVETAYLTVTLDHDSGTVDGRVKAGRFKDRRLGELKLNELLALLDELRRADSEGVSVLEAYMDRIHGPEWRSSRDTAGEKRTGAAGRLTRDEALEVLGLAPGATEAQIREAHRRLMLKVHPDHGGSSYLAARLNEARDILLKS